MPKWPQNLSNPAKATNCHFPVWLSLQQSSELHLQMSSPWLCSKFFLKSWSSTSPLSCLCTLGWLLTPVPNLPASLPGFISALPAPRDSRALSSTLITYNPIFWISLQLLDMLSPCSGLWLSWCTQALASDSWSRSFTSYRYLLPAFFLQAWCSCHSHTLQNALNAVGPSITEFLKYMASSSSILLAQVFVWLLALLVWFLSRRTL